MNIPVIKRHNVTFYRNRNAKCVLFLRDLVHCSDVRRVLLRLGVHKYDSVEFKLLNVIRNLVYNGFCSVMLTCMRQCLQVIQQH